MAKKKKITNLDHWKQTLLMCEQMPETMMTLNGWDAKQLEKEIAALKQQINQSKRGKSSKRKGAGYENSVAKKFLSKWGIKLVRTPSSGGFQKSTDNELIRGDLSCLDESLRFLLHIECKNQETWKLKEWWKQATDDCPNDNIPLVVYHQSQKNIAGRRAIESEDYIMIRLEDFLDIVDKDKVVLKTQNKAEKVKRDGERPVRKFVKKANRNGDRVPR